MLSPKDRDARRQRHHRRAHRTRGDAERLPQQQNEGWERDGRHETHVRVAVTLLHQELPNGIRHLRIYGGHRGGQGGVVQTDEDATDRSHSSEQLHIRGVAEDEAPGTKEGIQPPNDERQNRRQRQVEQGQLRDVQNGRRALSFSACPAPESEPTSEQVQSEVAETRSQTPGAAELSQEQA